MMKITRIQILQIFVFLFDGVGAMIAGLFPLIVLGQTIHSIFHFILAFLAIICAFHPKAAIYYARFLGIFLAILSIFIFAFGPHIPLMHFLLGSHSDMMTQNAGHAFTAIVNIYFGFFFKIELPQKV